MRFGRQMKRMLKKPREARELVKGSMFLVTAVLCLGLIIMSRGIEDYFVSDLKANAKILRGDIPIASGKLWRPALQCARS